MNCQEVSLGPECKGLYIPVTEHFTLADGTRASVTRHPLTAVDQLEHALLFNRKPPAPWPKLTYYVWKIVACADGGRKWFDAYYTMDIEIMQRRRAAKEAIGCLPAY